MSTPEALAAELERLVRREQRDKRLPSITAAVLRDGEPVWETAVGAADVAAQREATPDTQYRVGSITKTFTAAAIMQLRDEGKLDLEDTLDKHIEGAAHAPTLRRLLSHTSGLQRETHDDAWLHARFAAVPELLETLDRAEQVLPAGARFHYSNLAFALLGIVVERVSGMPYAEYVQERLLAPLGLGAHDASSRSSPLRRAISCSRTSRASGTRRRSRPARGSPPARCGGRSRDLCALGGVPRRAGRDVLKQDDGRGDAHGADDRRPRPLDGRLRARPAAAAATASASSPGHGGSMPGFIAGVYVSPADKVGVARPHELEHRAPRRARAEARRGDASSAGPCRREPWRVDEPPPDDVVPLLGIWFMEGDQVVFRWRERQARGAVPRRRRLGGARRVRARDATTAGASSPAGSTASCSASRQDAHGARRGYPVTREPGVWV